MIGRIEASYRRVRRFVSRSEWVNRFLGVPRARADAVQPGLIMVQIDGLSRRELLRALEAGRMPFLSRLLSREGHRLRSMYAGMPSCTPAAQAELFYGVKSAVPAFEYFDREKGRMARMYEPWSVSAVERGLEERGAPLLSGGSVHGDIFTGGAQEGRFCVSTWGWRGWRGRARVAPLLLFLTHLLLPFRLATLAVMELGLALYDFARGVTKGHQFIQELKFVASRVGVTVLMREFSVMGAKADMARGLSVVHVNFFGYDEQSHRRGPSSGFARWSLKGIDHAIRRLWLATRYSPARAYDLWVYSDHGQTACVPFSKEKGRPAPEAVSEALKEAAAGMNGKHLPAVRAYACNALSLNKKSMLEEPGGGDPHPILASMGPLGHLYLPSCPEEGREALARALVKTAGIPLVMAALPAGKARAWTEEGAFDFPEEGGKALGEDHPFLRATAGDMAALCHHPNAGEFVLYGWRKDGPPLSFALENGAHGGPSPQETGAFMLLPGDAPLSPPADGPMRLWHLRQAALRFLGRPTEDVQTPTRPSYTGARRRGTLRVMTYNVHACAGMDGRVSPERIARVIARSSPDVVALQELDANRRRSGGLDQAAAIAQALGMTHFYHPALMVEEEKYGDAILSRLPLKLVQAASLPGLGGQEPRGALWASVLFNGEEVQVINTHLGLLARERRMQVEALLGPDWLGSLDNPRVVLCGDFNAGPRSPVCRRLGARLRDAQMELTGRPPAATWFGRWPLGRIDHIFVGEGLRVVDAMVLSTELDKTASDHLPLLADLKLG